MNAKDMAGADVLEPSSGLEKSALWLRRAGKGCGLVLILLLVTVVAVSAWLWVQVRGSLPQLSGEVEVAGLGNSVALERDSLGIPVIRGSTRNDVAYGLGFAHGQDRFFQMDLSRRRSAGELSGLLGARLMRYDKGLRLHRFRPLSERVFESLSDRERTLLRSYADGVNAGVGSLRRKPIEYLALRATPAPWKAEDALLVQLAMFLALEDSDGDYDSFLRRLEEEVPEAVYRFLTPLSSPWDSSSQGFVDGDLAPIPGPEECTLETLSGEGTGQTTASQPSSGASNAWVLAGPKTASGRGLLAADMHLPLTVPNIWYRASFSWGDSSGDLHRVTGITLPGSPLMVAGSNEAIAWAFTSARIDVTDLVEIEEEPSAPGSYRTKDGARTFEVFRESIVASTGEEEVLEVQWSHWGPIIETSEGRWRALRWVAHQASAVNLDFLEMESAQSAEAALRVAQSSGLPAVNIFVADQHGNIGWTLAGKIPRRAEEPSGREIRSWDEASDTWNQWLEPGEVPQRLQPVSQMLWNANNRTVGGSELARLGDGNYVGAARGRQIEEGLVDLSSATAKDMLSIQLDNRALFLDRWRRLVLVALAQVSCDQEPSRCDFKELVETWGGKAAVDSSGYTLVRDFYELLNDKLSFFLVEGCGSKSGEEALKYFDVYGQADGPLWRLVEAQPRHLLPANYETWKDLFLEVVDEVIARSETPLEEREWGQRNRLSMNHFLSGAAPFLSRYLDMPAELMPGDRSMPRVQYPSFGSSQRMAVSPGLEEEGYFHMPGGQSGHPFSPHYRDGHQAWVDGEPTPFLPGPTVNILRLVSKEKGQSQYGESNR